MKIHFQTISLHCYGLLRLSVKNSILYPQQAVQSRDSVTIQSTFKTRGLGPQGPAWRQTPRCWETPRGLPSPAQILRPLPPPPPRLSACSPCRKPPACLGAGVLPARVSTTFPPWAPSWRFSLKERKSWTWALCSAAGHGFSFTLPTGWQLACCWFGGAGQMRGFWVRKARYSHTGDARALGYPSPPSKGPCGAAGGGCVCARDAQLGTASGGPGPINSARGKPWARGRPCLALEALDSGPGPERSPQKRQQASLSWHTRQREGGAWLVPRAPSRLWVSFWNKTLSVHAEVIWQQGGLFHFLFSVSNHTFPREFLPVATARSSLLGHVIWATGESGQAGSAGRASKAPPHHVAESAPDRAPVLTCDVSSPALESQGSLTFCGALPQILHLQPF